MFNAENVLVLAKAGFTAQQIAGLSMLASQPAQPTQPAQPVQPAQPAQPVDPVLAELQKLTGLVQGSNIMNENQPKVQTAEEILAEIINPPPRGDK